MPIRNIWSFEPGECLTAERMIKSLKDVQLYFPLRDTGVDILAVKGGKHAGIQVKESRYYSERSTIPAHCWHQISLRKMKRNINSVQFYVFLTYFPKENESKMSFENRFIVVPTDELKGRLQYKKIVKNDIYSFYFNFNEERILDKRVIKDTDPQKIDYTDFRDAWRLVNNFFSE